MAETNENSQESAPVIDKTLEALVFGTALPSPAATESGNGEPPASANPPIEGDGSQEESVVFDESAYIKQTFGYDTIEEAKAAYEELKTLKATPPVKAEHVFPNDEAKKYYQYFTTEGKEDELYSTLHARQQVKNLDSMNDEQKIKLFIKMNNPLYDSELIEAKYSRDYSFKEDDYKDDDGNVVDQIGFRLAKADSQQRLQNDIVKASEYFDKYKSKIQLPDINTQPSVDESYEDYKASTAKSTEEYNNIIAPSLNALKESDIQLNFKVDDPNNQMNFDVSVSAEKNDFEEAKKSALSFSDYLSKNFYDEKGGFKPTEITKAILLYKNFDKYAQTIARQAVNAERLRVVGQNSNGGGIVKDFNVVAKPLTETEQQAKMAFSV